MEKKKIILLGGGGHCKSCIDVIEAENIFSVEGILGLPAEKGRKILSYPIIGTDDDIEKFVKEGYSFLITIGYMGNSDLRKNLFNKLKRYRARLPVVISPHSRVSRYADFGEGTIIMHNCVVNSDTRIGNNCIINNKALIEHDVIIGNHCHVSTNAVVNGNCTIKDNCFIGSSSTLKNGITLESDIVIGAASLVLKSISDKGIYAGVPVRKIL